MIRYLIRYLIIKLTEEQTMTKIFHKLINQTVNAHFKRSTNQFAELGLSSGQPKVLERLVGIEGCMQKELAEACEVEPATMTSILPNMEKKGVIKRVPTIQKLETRELSVLLIEKGKAKERKVANIFAEVEDLSVTGYSQEEKNMFLQLLERVYQNIK